VPWPPPPKSCYCTFFNVHCESKLRLAGVPADAVARYRVAAGDEALQKMRQLLIQAGIVPATARLPVLHGDPWRHIIDRKQEQDCDLIVRGRCGEGVLEEFLLGSVTKHLLADCQCNALVSV